MSHYSNDEWQSYKKGQLLSDQQQAMEEHLLQCNPCLESFLSLINQTEIKIADSLLSPRFTERVMESIATEQRQEKVRRSAKQIRLSEKAKNMIIYYTAAASITLIFMGSGIFQYFVEGVHKSSVLSTNTQVVTKTVDLDISEKITNKTALFIKNLETQRRSE